MKFLPSFFLSFLLLLSLSTSAQIKLQEINGQLYYLPVGGTAYKPASPTVVGGTTSSTVVGPQGPQGAIGVTPVIGVTAITGAAGSSATVTKTGSGTAIGFTFTLPRGDIGASGSTPTITVNSVATLPYGSPATVSNSGTPTAVRLDFGLPRGDPGTNATVTSSQVRGFFSSTGDIDYDLQNGQFYLKPAQVNILVRNYINSLDGAAPGKVLSYVGVNQPPVWVTPTSTTVSSATTSPGGNAVSSDHIFADSTINRPNFALMVDVPLSTTAQIQTFCSTPQSNKRGIIAPASYTLLNGAQFTQTGDWDNVALTAPDGATFVATGGTTCMLLTNPHTAKRIGLYGITFTNTSMTNGGYPLLFSNELVGFQGWEIARCTFIGNNAGNFNGFNITQYSTTSNSGAVSSDFYMHDCEFINIPRVAVEILSQGYDNVRLNNLTIVRNKFRNSATNAPEPNRMATSISGLVTSIYHARNHSTNAKNMVYEFVNVKYAKAESNTAVATLETCVGYSVSDDGRNSTEQIYVEGGHFRVTSRPFQLLDSKDIHFKGGTYLAGRGIDVNCRNSSFVDLNVSCTDLLNAEAIFQFGGTSNGNVLKNSTLSSWGSAALGHEPSFETVVLRGPNSGGNTFNNQVTGNTLKQGKRPGITPATHFTPGDVVDQGTTAPANTAANNTVLREQ